MILPVAIIVIPCFIALVTLLIFLFTGVMNPAYSWTVAIPLVLGTAAFMLKRAIYEWWIIRNPPKLSVKEIDILERFFPYYHRLGSEHKSIFEKRIAIFRDQKKFQMRGANKIPGDIQLLVSATAMQLQTGFEDQDEFYPNLAVVIMFPRTFITPDLNEQLHALEVNKERYDSMFLAVNMFVKGIRQPKEYYNIGLYGFAKLFRLHKNITDDDLPYERKELLAAMHVIRRFPVGYIFKYTGLGDFEAFEMAVELFFTDPQEVRDELPKLYEYLVNLFKQDPLNYTSPGVQDAVYQIEGATNLEIRTGEEVDNSDEAKDGGEDIERA